MADGYQALTEKEKATLRLMARGHDAKSAARSLGLSVHTINERLRDARRKLGVSSSREAARLVLEHEEDAPQILGDEGLGEATPPPAVPTSRRPPRLAAIIAGGVVMMLLVGLFALLASPQAGPVATPAAAVAESGSSDAARQWLALVDGSRWNESWAATAASFRASNTVEAWADASRGARVPLGAVRSRALLSQDSVPAPPSGMTVVKFHTSFAAKADAVETVSLAREDGAWRVVGYYID